MANKWQSGDLDSGNLTQEVLLLLTMMLKKQYAHIGLHPGSVAGGVITVPPAP